MVVGRLAGRAISTCVAFLWPGYLCFKDIENDSGNLKKWCIYWTVIALYTAAERAVHSVLFWLPLYYEGTVLFAYFLAHLGGAEYIYATALRTLLLEHEGAIDARAEQARAWLRATFKNNVGWVSGLVQDKLFALVTWVQVLQTQSADRSREYVSVQHDSPPLSPPSPSNDELNAVRATGKADKAARSRFRKNAA